jgi:hypothetical protein
MPRPGGTVWCPAGGRSSNVGFGPSHRDFGNRIEVGIGTDAPLNVEQGVGDNETSNIEDEARDRYRAFEQENQEKG